MRRARSERHSLAGAYALDALTGTDRFRFERHMARCPRCAREIGELRGTGARLAAAAAREPPPGLIGRALTTAARTGQLRPVTRRHTARTPAGSPAGIGVRGRPSPPVGSHRRSLLPRLAVAATLAATVIAAVIFGMSALNAAHRLDQQQRRGQAMALVLTAPDATMISARIPAGGTATIVMSGRYRELVFAAAGLPALPRSRCYELWLMGPEGDRPAGMLPAPRHGMTGPVMASGLAEGDRLGLAIEPAGGGRSPGRAVILMVSL